MQCCLQSTQSSAESRELEQNSSCNVSCWNKCLVLLVHLYHSCGISVPDDDLANLAMSLWIQWSAEPFRVTGQELLISQHAVPLLLIRELWEKTAFLLTSMDDYSSWNPRYCYYFKCNWTYVFTLELQPVWVEVPLWRCYGSDLHPSQRMEVTDHQVCAVSSSESDRPVRVVEVFLNLENLKWGNELLSWFVCWGLAACGALLIEVKNYHQGTDWQLIMKSGAACSLPCLPSYEKIQHHSKHQYSKFKHPCEFQRELKAGSVRKTDWI